MFIVPKERHLFGLLGCVTVGGLAATSLLRVCGTIQGSSIRAARDAAIPLANITIMAKWATEQAELLSLQPLSPEEQAGAAQVVYKCGGDTKHLKIFLTRDGWLNAHEMMQWSANQVEIKIVDMFHYLNAKRARPDLELNSNVVTC